MFRRLVKLDEAGAGRLAVSFYARVADDGVVEDYEIWCVDVDLKSSVLLGVYKDKEEAKKRFGNFAVSRCGALKRFDW